MESEVGSSRPTWDTRDPVSETNKAERSSANEWNVSCPDGVVDPACEGIDREGRERLLGEGGVDGQTPAASGNTCLA